MLIIDREPLYKNKFFLGGLAVLSGFVLTMGIIRLVNPANDTTSQSTQSTSDRRAASLIPIPASDSESSSEDGSSNEPEVTDGSASGAVAPAPSTAWPGSTSQPGSQLQPTSSSGSATTPQPSAPADSQSTSQPSQPSGGTTDGSDCELSTSSLTGTIQGILVNGVCTAL